MLTQHACFLQERACGHMQAAAIAAAARHGGNMAVRWAVHLLNASRGKISITQVSSSVLKPSCTLLRAPSCGCASIRSTHVSAALKTMGAIEEREEATGLFGCPEFSDAAGFARETKRCVDHSRKLVAAISAKTSNPDSTIIDLMDELSDELCRVADLAECIRQVHSDPEIASAAQDACLAINSYVEELNTNRGLYTALRALMDSPDYKNLDEVSRRTSEVFMHDFEISGIHLEESVRKEMVKLNDYLLEVGYLFSLNATQPTLLDSNKCPLNLREYYHEKGGEIYITYVPFNSFDPDVRENSYLAFYAPNQERMDVFEEMVSSRQKLARLAGYPSFAHRALKLSMAQTPETVVQFLELLSTKILPLAREDVAAMKQIQTTRRDIFKDSEAVKPWDISLLVSEAQKINLPVRSDSVKNWFSIESCIAGLGNLFKSLFGVTLKILEVKKGEVWHLSVYKFGFFDEDGECILGYTYGDLAHREDKLALDCHFTIRGGREVRTESGNVGYQTPIITLCCSMESPDVTGKCLLSQSSVETLFHEMGHALHSMLGRAKYQNITGTRCSTDFAEVPSTLMEFFLNDNRVLASFAKHHKTSEALPAPLAKAFQLSGHFFAAYDMQVQIANAIADQKFHATPFTAQSAGWSEAVYREVSETYSPLGHVPNTAYYLRFPHLCSYGGRYYSYLWSKAVASLVWKSSFYSNPFSRQAGEKYRKMLSYGGGVNPRRLVSDMLGFEPTIEQLVDALCDDVMRHREQIKTLEKE